MYLTTGPPSPNSSTFLECPLHICRRRIFPGPTVREPPTGPIRALKPTILARLVHRRSGDVRCPSAARAITLFGSSAHVRFRGILGLSGRSLSARQGELSRIAHRHRDDGATVRHAQKSQGRIGAHSLGNPIRP